MTSALRLERVKAYAEQRRRAQTILIAELAQGREEGLTLRELAAAASLSVEGVRRMLLARPS